MKPAAEAIVLAGKVCTVAREVSRAAGADFPPGVAERPVVFQAAGFGSLSVRIARTFCADPGRMGAPESHILPMRERHLSVGVGFVVVICGGILIMPGLPRAPATDAIRLDSESGIERLS